ncbi:MAG: DUF3604 domain-containing protein [Candidatus Hydrogenedentes bacterium]|nr:DUF3604 domain-containing protein [Candidatus Hydrogenedentota bacterium]
MSVAIAFAFLGIAAAESVRVEPSTAISGNLGTWMVVYTVGDGGIAQGGALRVELPDAMHGGPRNSANRLQATEADAPNYVSACCARESVLLLTTVERETGAELVKHPKPSLDGRYERYVFVVRVEVARGGLEAGDTVSVVYGDTSKGSPGYRAGDVISPPLPVLLAVDKDGGGAFRRVEEKATLQIVPGPVAEVLVHAPSRGVAGQTARVLVALLDAHANPATAGGSVRLGLESGAASLPERVEVPAGASHVTLEVTPESAGVLRVRAALANSNIRSISNPMEVFESPPTEQLLWGDIHSHTEYSWDGIGFNAFDYARYISGLDFYARTDHSTAPEPEGTRGLNLGNWEAYCAEAEAHHAPLEFVTLHAYEASFGAPYGHHNVYFRGAPGRLVYYSQTTLPELWAALKRGEALTIPHHTGKFPRGIDLSIHDPALRRNFEIYSGHGLSEAYDPEHPLSFEHSDFTSPAKSVTAPTYAQDAWRLGQRLSTVAASDDHRAKPGQPQYGLTAIYAPARTREAVFDALYHRRTYGTTGVKIILDFALDGTPMGSEAKVSTQPSAHIHVLGTDIIAAVELLQWVPGTAHFVVVQRWEPDALQFDETCSVTNHTAGAIYYVGLQQTNIIRGRAVCAWSSPIWTVAGA